jgi:methylglutaconyl-CoA hydratase
MNYESLTYTVSNRIAIVTLNRPERRNALDDVMIRELTDVFNSSNRNVNIRAIVLTGNGPTFCAGMDLDYLQKYSRLGQAENLEDAQNLLKLLLLMYGLKKPVIAMVNGPALGGGCGLAAACDFVFAGKEMALLGAPEVKLGFIPAVILVFLIKRMGEAKAKEFVLRGDVLNASAAQSRGLVTEIIDDAKLSDAVVEFAETLIRSTSGASVTLTKELFSRINDMSTREVLDYAANLNALVRKTEDFQKGIDAFFKKERIQW